MPSYCIHIAHGLETLNILKKFLESKNINKIKLHKLRKRHPDAIEAIVDNNDNKWKQQFMAGLILPDAAKKTGCSNSNKLDRISHYPKSRNGYFKTPDMRKFLKEYPLSLDNPLTLGYAMHLYLDSKYDDFLQGICDFCFDSSNEVLQHITCAVKDNTQGIIENKILTEAEFWQILYNDYTKLNPYYKKNNEIKIDSFITVDEISPMFIAQVAWYKELYKCMKDEVLKEAEEIIQNNQVEFMKSQLELLDVSLIDKLVAKEANDFFNIFLKPLVNSKKADNISKKSDDEEKNNWNAESLKLEYYKTKWNDFVDKGYVETADESFFDGVIEEIQDVTNHATIHRNKHKKISDLICGIPLLTTVFSGISTLLSDDLEKFLGEERFYMISLIFNFSLLSTFFSALLSIINSYNEKTAYKETWLRQRLYYSMLMLETEKFCEGIGEYSTSNKDAVKKYMKNINKLRKKDYENFFINMGCSNFEKD